MTRARKDEAPRASGWRTTDEHEIERRRERGEEEVAEFEKIGDRREIFGAYRVPSVSGEIYVVEIRSLAERVNSCGCLDHRTNLLGTCKHVEGVLGRLRSRRGFASARRGGNAATELFVDRRRGRPALLRSSRRGRRSRAEHIVESSASADGHLVGVPARALERIDAELSALPASARSRVRVSRYIEDWLADVREREAARRARRAFERDVDAGKPATDLVRVPLYPYQQQGVLHLAFTGRAILADEMGLGKTIQATAACELLARLNGVSRVLVVTPASLKGEWAEQIATFTDRSVCLVDGPACARRLQYRRPAFFHLVNYEQVRQDVAAINELLAPEIVILDEAQRIKNWRTLTATQVKRLRSRFAFVLTGTPLENRIDEVYSIAQFLDPTLFGPLFRFNREFYVLDDRGRPVGYRNLDEMHRRLQPIMLRRRKDEVEGDLPGRSVTNHFVTLAPEQEEQYESYQAIVARLVAIAQRRPLRKQEFDRLQRSLACMRMACDTPFILDRKTRISPKIDELEKLLEELLAGTSSKAIVFSEWERMLVVARERIERTAPGSAWHTGSTPQQTRRGEIRRFKEDPACRILFSTDSGSVGLNLQVADVVINLDLPWNPARLEQRIARAWRKHQRRHVRVVNLVSENTIEHRMLDTLEHKRRVAESVIDGRAEAGMLPLRSGRAALIERIEALGVGSERAPAAPAQPSTPRAQESLATMLDRTLGEALVEVRQHRAEGGSDAVLVVVETADDDTRIAVARCVDAFGDAPRPRIEVIDVETWRVIERLIQAGVLRPGDAAPGDETPMVDEEGLERQRERVTQAGKTLEAARRQLGMARLLVGGGFEREAAPALRDSFDSLLESLVVLAEDASESTGRGPDVARIGARFALPDEFPRCTESLGQAPEAVDVHQCLDVGERAILAATRARADAMV